MNRRLNRVRDSYYEFRRLENKIEQLETLTTHITAVISDMPMSHGVPTEKQNSWAMLADYRTECEMELRSLIANQRALTAELEIIRDPSIKTAMQLRYVDCLNPEEIAVIMSYSVRHIQRKLRKGEKIYNLEYGDENCEEEKEESNPQGN